MAVASAATDADQITAVVQKLSANIADVVNESLHLNQTMQFDDSAADSTADSKAAEPQAPSAAQHAALANLSDRFSAAVTSLADTTDVVASTALETIDQLSQSAEQQVQSATDDATVSSVVETTTSQLSELVDRANSLNAQLQPDDSETVAIDDLIANAKQELADAGTQTMAKLAETMDVIQESAQSAIDELNADASDQLAAAKTADQIDSIVSATQQKLAHIQSESLKLDAQMK